MRIMYPTKKPKVTKNRLKSTNQGEPFVELCFLDHEGVEVVAKEATDDHDNYDIGNHLASIFIAESFETSLHDADVSHHDSEGERKRGS